jgi:2-polyprenyl-6-methoxyphenol hydroxylase-like FAD-dependent oxidoreductase
MDIIIVGAGLAGPLLAQGLRRAGVGATVFERDRADQLSQGYRIHIAPEGELAMRDCLPPELHAEVLATSGLPGSGWRVLDPQLHTIQEHLVPQRADADGPGGRHLTVDRQTLRRILLTGLDVRYEAVFERFEFLPDGRVRAEFAGGTRVEGDLLVAADGTHSRIRAQLLPQARVIETGTWELYGKTMLTDEVRALLPAAALDGFCVVAGGDGRFMPLAAHRFRSGRDDYVMWVVGGPAARFPAGVSTLDQAAMQEAAAQLVEDWHPSLSAVVRLGEPGSVHFTTVRTAHPLEHWTTVPVTLMGDAIHTMIPQGTSAAVALRDAGLLCRRLTEGSALLEAVHAYETEMLDYGFAEVARSLQSAG